MVLAQIIKRKYIEQDVEQGFEPCFEQTYEQGFAQGFVHGYVQYIEQARRERAEQIEAYTKELEAWAKAKGIPFDDMPRPPKPKFRDPKVQANLALARVRKKR